MSSPGPASLLLDTHYWVWMQLGEAEHFTARMLTAIRQAAASGSLLGNSECLKPRGGFG